MSTRLTSYFLHRVITSCTRRPECRFPVWAFTPIRASPQSRYAVQSAVVSYEVLESANYERRTCSLASARSSLCTPSDSKTRVIITQIGSSRFESKKVFRRAHDARYSCGAVGQGEILRVHLLTTFGILNEKGKLKFYERNFSLVFFAAGVAQIICGHYVGIYNVYYVSLSFSLSRLSSTK